MWFIGIFVRVVHTKSRWIELLCLDDSKTMLPLWKIIYKKKPIGFRPQVYQQLDSARKPQASLFEIEFHLSSKLKNNIDIWFAIKPSTWNNEPNGTHISNQECLYILFGISREQFRFPVNHQTHLFYVYIYTHNKIKDNGQFCSLVDPCIISRTHLLSILH